MKPKSVWANLAVEDLGRTTKFYTQLGFKPNSPHTSDELTSFFISDSNFVIHFFLKEKLQPAMKGEIVDTKHANEIIFSLSASSREEVDTCMEDVKKAGGTIFSAPENFQQGYTFGFADPDGHKFNVLYWPGM
jgi:predicted lactoylglutathione lyase